MRTADFENLNPGSELAIDAGCRCPAEINQYGAGLGVGPLFAVFASCPLHGWKRPVEKAPVQLEPGQVVRFTPNGEEIINPNASEEMQQMQPDEGGDRVQPTSK